MDSAPKMDTAPSAKCCSSPASGPGFASALDAMREGRRETLLYVTCIQPKGQKEGKRDYLAVVDADPDSPAYSTVISRIFTAPGDELHHFGWNSCSSCFSNPDCVRNRLILPALNSDRIYVLDTSDQKQPKLLKVINELGSKTGLGAPHTTHCLPSGDVMVSCMGDARGNAKGSFALIDSTTWAIKGRWESEESLPVPFGYDFWYQPRHDVMVSTEWGAPRLWRKGFNPGDVGVDDAYGKHLNFWNWTSRKLEQRLDLGQEGWLPLEVRFLHDPAKAEGFVGCALSSNVFRFFKNTSTGKWEANKVISVAPKIVRNWLLDQMPGLVTDILLSLDDHFLYFSNWIHGDIRQYDITDTANPRLVGQIFLGGSLCRDDLVKVLEDRELDQQPERPEVKGIPVRGGPQMLQLSLDGKRLYVTNSLLSSWDEQFYPDMVRKGSQMLQIDVNTDEGGLTVNPAFLVDFGGEPEGPVLGHEVRYPGGDCTSDIWL